MSLFSPIIAQFYMEDYEKAALELTPTKTPLLVSLHRWHLRHMPTWSWQTQRLPTPPKWHPSIHSVHYGNRKWKPPPLPGLRYLQETWWLWTHTHTHTHLYLSTKFHHHSSNKQAVLSNLMQSASALWDEDGLQAELVFLREPSTAICI
jgi:hypothetical protein